MPPRVVLDTNVIVAAFQSGKGASNAILRELGTGKFTHVYSNALLYEYEEVLLRLSLLTVSQLETFLTFFVQQGEATMIYFRLRPQLNDPKDEHILELAFSARASYLVTFNLKDFLPVREFGINVILPRDFLHLMKGENL
jgi:putative PIN family toxin of toxin-antitoxin system